MPLRLAYALGPKARMMPQLWKEILAAIRGYDLLKLESKYHSHIV